MGTSAMSTAFFSPTADSGSKNKEGESEGGKTTGSDQGKKLTRRIALVALSGGHCLVHGSDAPPTPRPRNVVVFRCRIQSFLPSLALAQTHSLRINHRVSPRACTWCCIRKHHPHFVSPSVNFTDGSKVRNKVTDTILFSGLGLPPYSPLLTFAHTLDGSK